MLANTVNPYLLLNAAAQLFGKAAADLNDEERAKAAELALKEGMMQQKVLESVEAAGVPVDEAELAVASKEIEERYPSHDEYLDDLARNGLDEASLTDSLRDALRVEKVMARVAAEVTVGDEEIAAYYHEHSDKFTHPELREARHILITFNDDYKENRPKAVKERLQKIADELQQSPDTFADLAMRHSECPTALEGGYLGKLPEGKLYPALDKALFEMEEGEVRSPLKSPMGLHILRCEKIHAAGTAPLEEVTEKIREYLLEPKARLAQRAWIRKLFAGDD